MSKQKVSGQSAVRGQGSHEKRSLEIYKVPVIDKVFITQEETPKGSTGWDEGKEPQLT